jgi:hypothetical protein
VLAQKKVRYLGHIITE